MRIYQHALVWLRRDLRCHHHPALLAALQQAQRVSLVFVFDAAILAQLPKYDARVSFIWQALQSIRAELARLNVHVPLHVVYGDVQTCLLDATKQLNIDALFYHEDYEVYAQTRDTTIATSASAKNIAVHALRDHVLTPHSAILTQKNTPYTVFSPYKKAALAYLQQHPHTLQAAHIDWSSFLPGLRAHAANDGMIHLHASIKHLADIGFEEVPLKIPTGMAGADSLWQDFKQRMAHYHLARDYPGVKGVSYLSTHLRFGTIAIQTLAQEAWQNQAHQGAQTWLSELLWRDFFSYIFYHFPHVQQGLSFKPAYDAIVWDNEPHLLQAWQQGQTGYPIVDAAMRQLNQTGYMHNRLRMVAASFLCKNLGLDWRLGEAYFAEKLLDFDAASNNGGWQWSASTGCDAQPYFRIFNPYLQSKKFDEHGHFIHRYVPELANLPAPHIHQPHTVPPMLLASNAIILGKTYPHPVVNYEASRARTLERFATTLKEQPNVTSIE